ncbi:MAG: hypothetical protein ACI9GW_002432 [Halieaceae bacterium]|jgi:hypothetical protein
MTNLIRVCGVLLLFITLLAQAGDDLAGQLKQCRLVGADNDRLACYDAITPGRSTETTITTGAPASQATVEAQATTTNSEVDREFGSEDVKKIVAETDERIYVEVLKTKKGRAQESTIYLKNGQVWRQIGTDRYTYNERQGRAYLERGSMSSYFFSQDEIKRRIRVKRLK